MIAEGVKFTIILLSLFSLIITSLIFLLSLCSISHINDIAK